MPFYYNTTSGPAGQLGGTWEWMDVHAIGKKETYMLWNIHACFSSAYGTSCCFRQVLVDLLILDRLCGIPRERHEQHHSHLEGGRKDDGRDERTSLLLVGNIWRFSLFGARMLCVYVYEKAVWKDHSALLLICRIKPDSFDSLELKQH